MKKNTITACLCLVLSVAVMVYSGMNFLAARELPLPRMGTQRYRGEDAFRMVRRT